VNVRFIASQHKKTYSTKTLGYANSLKWDTKGHIGSYLVQKKKILALITAR